MECLDCGIEIKSLPCERCAQEAADHEREIERLVEEFSLVRGEPETNASQASLDFALTCLEKRLGGEHFRETVSSSARDLLHAISNLRYAKRILGLRPQPRPYPSGVATSHLAFRFWNSFTLVIRILSLSFRSRNDRLPQNRPLGNCRSALAVGLHQLR